MKLDRDKIQFEEREEVRQVLEAIDTFLAQNEEAGKNMEAVQTIYKLLDELDMCW